MDTKDIDLKALHVDLTEAFINFQHRLENPMPLNARSEDIETKIMRYRTDTIFHSKVASMTAHVMNIVSKHINHNHKG